MPGLPRRSIGSGRRHFGSARKVLRLEVAHEWCACARAREPHNKKSWSVDHVILYPRARCQVGSRAGHPEGLDGLSHRALVPKGDGTELQTSSFSTS